MLRLWLTQPLLDAVEVANREATNRFGHVIIASECLEQLGIEHFVSYANQHAMVTLFDRSSERAFLLDVATEELCCDMTGVIGSGASNPLDQLAMGELRAVNTFFFRGTLETTTAVGRQAKIYLLKAMVVV